MLWGLTCWLAGASLASRVLGRSFGEAFAILAASAAFLAATVSFLTPSLVFARFLLSL